MQEGVRLVVNVVEHFAECRHDSSQATRSRIFQGGRQPSRQREMLRHSSRLRHAIIRDATEIITTPVVYVCHANYVMQAAMSKVQSPHQFHPAGHRGMIYIHPSPSRADVCVLVNKHATYWCFTSTHPSGNLFAYEPVAP